MTYCCICFAGAPKIVEPVTQTESIVGQPATLFCKAKGTPDPVIEWRKEGVTIDVLKKLYLHF
jgi:hypothetical protein